MLINQNTQQHLLCIIGMMQQQGMPQQQGMMQQQGMPQQQYIQQG